MIHCLWYAYTGVCGGVYACVLCVLHMWRVCVCVCVCVCVVCRLKLLISTCSLAVCISHASFLHCGYSGHLDESAPTKPGADCSFVPLHLREKLVNVWSYCSRFILL